MVIIKPATHSSRARYKLQQLHKLYTDLQHSPAAYTSVEPLLREARKKFPSISRRECQSFLDALPSYTRHRRAVHNFRRLPTLAAGLHTDWQADLADLQLLSRANRGYRYLLVCIDVLSRQLFVEPMRRKFAVDAVKAFKEIFKRARVIPWRIYTDQGKEFIAAPVQQLFCDRHIMHRLMVTSPQFHAGMVERAIRSIKERVWKIFTAKRTHCWLNIIQEIVSGINNSPHSALPEGLAPQDITFSNAQHVRRQLWSRAGVNPTVTLRTARAPSVKTKFAIGDRVRIEKRKHPFEKGYLPRFSEAVYTVVRVRSGDRRLAPRLPTTYRLAFDINTRLVLQSTVM